MTWLMDGAAPPSHPAAVQLRALASSVSNGLPASAFSFAPATVTAASSDFELARALSARDPEAQRICWERFRPLVSGMVRRALGKGAEHEDVVQDVFLRVFAGMPGLREPGALRAFVITVTKRTVGHEARKRRARLPLMLDHESQVSALPGMTADGAARLAFQHLRHLLERMNERERHAFVLRFVDRMEARELAQALGVSEPTARRAYSRAWKRMLTWATRHPFLNEYVESWDVAMRPPIARGAAHSARPPALEK